MIKIKTLTVLALLFTLSAGVVNAQRKIKEGLVIYNVSYEPAAGQQQDTDSLPKEITCYFRGDSSAAIINQGTAVIKGVSVIKNNYHSMLIDMPASSQKIVVLLTPAEVEEEKAANPQITGVKGKEKQSINGYNCFKETITDPRSGKTYEIWLTKDIYIAPNSVSKLVSVFGGVPIKFVTFNRGIKINAELKEIKETTVPAGFFTATKDYETMSFSDLQKMSKGN
jgi:hypothetical protein